MRGGRGCGVRCLEEVILIFAYIVLVKKVATYKGNSGTTGPSAGANKAGRGKAMGSIAGSVKSNIRSTMSSIRSKISSVAEGEARSQGMGSGRAVSNRR